MNTTVPTTEPQQATQMLFFTSKEAAHYLRLSPQTLAAFRVKGSGPDFCKFGRKVVYRLSDLETWAEANRRQSTTKIN